MCCAVVLCTTPARADESPPRLVRLPSVVEPIVSVQSTVAPQPAPYAVVPAAAYQPTERAPLPPRTLPPVPDVKLPHSLEEYDPVAQQLREQAAQIEQLRADLDRQ